MPSKALRRVRLDKIRLKGTPVTFTLKSFARVCVELGVLEDLPPDFSSWQEFESDRFFIFMERKGHSARILKKTFHHIESQFAGSGAGTGEPFMALSASVSGEDVAAILVEKSHVRGVANEYRRTLERSSPRTRTINRLPSGQQEHARRLLSGELWDAADAGDCIHFLDHHGRAVARNPDLARNTAELAREFESTGHAFLQLAEYVCRSVQLTEFYEPTWGLQVKSGFQKLDAKKRQHLGAAVGALIAPDSPLTKADKKQIANIWSRTKKSAKDRRYLKALKEAEREVGGQLLTKTDAGEHKSARPVITTIAVSVVDTLLKTKGMSKRRAYDLTDRLLLLLVSTWYDHEKPSPDRVRHRYEYAKKKLGSSQRSRKKPV
ncbi:MAG: hypothetical protein DHS20C21_05190 [Gemmatimonadota bacterium]|nr:MAG: hypothetical protein DHS20C21_05190 [Gemmatimonadota bacterium]